MPMTARNTASATLMTRRFTYLLFFLFGLRASAGQCDDGHAQVGAVEGAGVWADSAREKAVEAVAGSLAIIRRVKPVRGIEAGQVVPGDDEVCEPLQRVGGRPVAGRRDVDGHQQRRPILLCALQKLLAGRVR